MTETANVAQRASNNLILLIDDQPIFLKAIAALLEELGYRVTPTSCPMEAIQFFKEKSYFLVLCDLYMSSLSGYKLLTRFNHDKPEQVCCLMTGAELDEPLLKKTLRLNNVKGYIKKPIKFEELDRLLANIKKQQLSV
ncbi:response regulator [Thalassotalea marina]|uniref:Response regulatory domain-containing protein n=1 Tax=Thalassotalea marina TaxID=1673741 RepID=A0A919BD65_9GAMM|nr:response regulator [Thalassotalea marina]GHF83888.1 hypothetical protein GCM10017161_09010 [Thalassotalea marina]